MPAPTLSVPTPCPESWQHMTPTTTGRHCAACQTVVIDFTGFSDAELLAYLGRHAGQATCGRFRVGQLNRPLRPVVAAGGPQWRAWLAAVVTVWGLREVAAPAARAQALVEQRERRRAGNTTPLTVGLVVKPTVIVRGTIMDADGPLPGATILLKGTKIAVSSSVYGKFELTIPSDTATVHSELTISFVGYEARQIMLTSSLDQYLRVVMTPTVMGNWGVAVVAGGARVYYPWYSPQGLWQRLKRPFQH